MIESPSREDPEAGRFVVDTDGFVRSWERVVACYERGRLSYDDRGSR